MKCPNGHETSGKFCGTCGAAVELTLTVKCPNGHETSGKFCGTCGEPTGATRSEVTRKSCIYWDVQPKLVAQRLEETQMDHYGVAQGIIIHEGTRALIYTAGDYVGEFTSGKYTLLSPGAKGDSKKSGKKMVRHGGIWGGFKAGVRDVLKFLLGEKMPEEEAEQKEAQEKQETEQKKASLSQRDMQEDDFIKVAEQGKPFTIVLARDGEFTLAFNYDQLDTAEVRSDVSLQLRVKITDLKAFYRQYLQDHLFVSMGRLQADLASIVDLEVASAIKGLKIDEIGRNRELLEQMATAINQELGRTLKFMNVTRVFKITAQREEIEKLKKMAEDLYLADKQLDQQLKDDEINHRWRLRDNANEILEFKDDRELDVEMKKLNKDKFLSVEDFDRFKKRLELDSRLADAKDDDEKESVLVEYEKNDIIRDSDVQLLRTQTDMGRGHTLDLLDISNRTEKDKSRLEWEHEIGDADIQLEVDRRRRRLINEAEFVDLEWDARSRGTDHELEDRKKREDYGDTRRGKDRDFDQDTRRGELDIQKGEEGWQDDRLERGARLKKEMDQAEHERDMAELRTVKDSELDQRKVTKDMTAEQILAEKGQSEAAVARAKAEAEIAARDDRGKAADEKLAMADKIMDRMERMATTSMETTTATAGAQISREKEQTKQEQERSKETTEAMKDVTSSTAAAVGEGIKGKPQSQKKCVDPECGAVIEAGNDFCKDCGTKQS